MSIVLQLAFDPYSFYDLFLREGMRLAGQFGGFGLDQLLGDALRLGERLGGYYLGPPPYYGTL